MSFKKNTEEKYVIQKEVYVLFCLNRTSIACLIKHRWTKQTMCTLLDQTSPVTNNVHTVRSDVTSNKQCTHC